MGDGSRQAVQPRILLVDDDVRSVRRLVAGLLERGYVVSTAAAASDALAMLEQGSFNVVVADVVVPRKEDRYSKNETGETDENYDVRFLADIRKTPDMATMPFIALTTDPAVKSKIRWLGAGADEYITKPCAVEEICTRVIGVLERSAALPAPSGSLEDPVVGPRDGPAGDCDLYGDLSKHPARELIQDLNRNGKTGVLRVESAAGKGEVTFARGYVLHATFARTETEEPEDDPVEGERAFCEIFPLEDGEFGFRSDPGTIRCGIGELLVKAELMRGPAARAAESDRGPVAEVLLVEGDERTSRSVASGLSGFGCRVTSKTSAAEALEALDDRDFDVFVADMAMPDMDGFRFRSRLRRKRDGAAPLVFLVAEEDVDQKAAGLRADEYVTSPVASEELWARIVAAFWRSEAARAPDGERDLTDGPSDCSAREMVLNINRNEKTGVLLVESTSGKGEVFFAKGHVVHATFVTDEGETEGEEAFGRVFLMEEGTFEFRPSWESIARDWNELLFMAFQPGLEAEPPPGRSVLLVDDYEPTLKVLQRHLERHGHMVIATPSAGEALEMLEQESFDILIADVVMPGVDGFDFLRKVRGGSAAPTIPFVFLTSDRSVDSRALGFSLGVDEYLTKPCPPAELHARMTAVLRRWDGTHPPAGPADMAGDLSRHPAEEIIQNLKSNAKTGRLRVATPFGPGEVFFEEGNVTHGSFGGIDGEEGIYLLFALDEGRFDFLSGAKTARKLMALDTGALALEGLRRMDETREILAMRTEAIRRAAGR